MRCRSRCRVVATTVIFGGRPTPVRVVRHHGAGPARRSSTCVPTLVRRARSPNRKKSRRRVADHAIRPCTSAGRGRCRARVVERWGTRLWGCRDGPTGSGSTEMLLYLSVHTRPCATSGLRQLGQGGAGLRACRLVDDHDEEVAGGRGRRFAGPLPRSAPRDTGPGRRHRHVDSKAIGTLHRRTV